MTPVVTEKEQLLADFHTALQAKETADERFSDLAFDLISEWTIEADCSAHDILRAVQRHLDMEHDHGGFDAGSGCPTCAAPHPVNRDHVPAHTCDDCTDDADLATDEVLN
jgi:hypothetical protein